MGRKARSPVLAVAGVVLAGFGLAGCGVYGNAPANAGQSASVGLSLTTVPTVRSVTVTVSRASASFANCTGGQASLDTPSTPAKLGFPNGRCFVGLRSLGRFPITITNTGIASEIYVNGTSAIPSSGGDLWSLCTRPGDGGSACAHDDGKLPGTDQYMVENFSAAGVQSGGISVTPSCDTEFDGSGRCWAVQHAAGHEGIELIGPSFTTNTSTKWTITITWTPVPGHG